MMPKLTNGERAVVDPRKLTSYVLDPSHRTGRHKARVFAAALGLEAGQADALRAALLGAAAANDAQLSRHDSFGAHYALEFQFAFGLRSVLVRSLWVVRAGEDFPRFVSAFVVGSAHD